MKHSLAKRRSFPVEVHNDSRGGIVGLHSIHAIYRLVSPHCGGDSERVVSVLKHVSVEDGGFQASIWHRDKSGRAQNPTLR
jgi:hypothetical protein